MLQSLGPHTVVRYLNFAIGKGIGPADDNETSVVRGLENICLQDTARSTSVRSRASKASRTSHASRRSAKTPIRDIFVPEPNAPPVPVIPATKEAGADTNISTSSDSEFDSDDDLGEDDEDEGKVFLYGNASNKIGEAAACWLCRWGTDMLAYEESVISAESADSRTGLAPSSALSAPDALRIPGSSGTSLPSSSGSVSASSASENVEIPVIWRRGGLSARWARAVLSSDSFFVRSERERYEFAKRVVELRRQGLKVEKKEEVEWTELFSTGIYYMHMVSICVFRNVKSVLMSLFSKPLDDLMEIAQDVSPTTGKPYAPPSVLQAAHWNQSLLRHRISHRPSNTTLPLTPPRSPGPNASASSSSDGLGLALTTSEILARLADHQDGSLDEHKMYYPVPVDSSSRVGDTNGIENATMDQLFSPPTSPNIDSPSSPSAAASKPSHMSSHTLSTFFGIQTLPHSAASAIESDTTGRKSWSPFPPIRFGIEFWGVEKLKEKDRLTSQTIWYAGSLFNVYVQVMRRKGMQLGMYVHRLSPVETIPAPSAPPAPPSTFTFLSQEPRMGVAFERSETIDVPPSMSTPQLYRPTSRNTVAIPPRSVTPASSPGSRGGLSYSPPMPVRSIPATGGPLTHAHTHSAGSRELTPSLGLAGTQAPSTSSNGTTTPVARPPPQPYRDSREAVRAHFTLHCASPTGTALTRFASEPDRFLVGRSWGWKSSALQTEELVDLVDVDASLGGDVERGKGKVVRKECSLRAMVVLGVV